jgi:hypothetical protein
MWDIEIYTIGHYSSIRKEWKSVTCSSLEGTREHYVKWNKPGIEW